MSLSRYSRTVKLGLKRIGTQTTVYRPSGGSTNGYGKTDGEWENPNQVGTWYSYRSYNYKSDKPEQQYTGSGEFDEDTPVFIMSSDADVQDGDRLEHSGTRYEVMSDPVNFDTHYEIFTQKVN